MQTLEQISKEYEQEVIDKQLEILKNCARGDKKYKFIEDNLPPIFKTISLNEVTGDPCRSYSEPTPYWNPDLKKLSRFFLNAIKSKKINLPLQKNNSTKQEVFVLDRNGVIDINLYISDAGINCIYNHYSILDTLAPFLGRNISLKQLEPFYTFRDESIMNKNLQK